MIHEIIQSIIKDPQILYVLTTDDTTKQPLTLGVKCDKFPITQMICPEFIKQHYKSLLDLLPTISPEYDLNVVSRITDKLHKLFKDEADTFEKEYRAQTGSQSKLNYSFYRLMGNRILNANCGAGMFLTTLFQGSHVVPIHQRQGFIDLQLKEISNTCFSPKVWLSHAESLLQNLNAYDYSGLGVFFTRLYLLASILENFKLKFPGKYEGLNTYHLAYTLSYTVFQFDVCNNRIPFYKTHKEKLYHASYPTYNDVDGNDVMPRIYECKCRTYKPFNEPTTKEEIKNIINFLASVAENKNEPNPIDVFADTSKGVVNRPILYDGFIGFLPKYNFPDVKPHMYNRPVHKEHMFFMHNKFPKVMAFVANRSIITTTDTEQESIKRLIIKDSKTQELDFSDDLSCLSVDKCKCVFVLKNRNHQGKTVVSCTDDGQRISHTRNLKDILPQSEYRCLPILNPKHFEIVKKISPNTTFFHKHVVGPRPFGFDASYVNSSGDITYHNERGETKMIDGSLIKTNADDIGLWKVVFDASTDIGILKQRSVLSGIKILPPNHICSTLFFMVKGLQTKKQASYIEQYLKTRLVRFIIGACSHNNYLYTEQFQYIPDVKLKEPPTDEFLYLKFKLTKDEIKTIESSVCKYD